MTLESFVSFLRNVSARLKSRKHSEVLALILYAKKCYLNLIYYKKLFNKNALFSKLFQKYKKKI